VSQWPKPDAPPLWSGAGVSFLWEYLAAHQNYARPESLDQPSIKFLGYCLARYGRSRAQLFQDCYVTWKLGEGTPGYFVEFGATDGVALSNTWRLEADLGWTGLLAEPFPAWHAALQANRRARIDHRCVWRRSGETLEFLAVRTIPELASIKAYAGNDQHAAERLKSSETIPVQSVTLTDLLAEHGAPRTIDYLSVDVEGAELDALESLDFERFRPRIVTVEHNFDEARRTGIESLLGSQGFVREFEQFSGFDDWYCHPERV
jgi:FkbM family methyltransferase